MSAAEMTANGQQIPGAVEQIEDAIGMILHAQALVEELQDLVRQGICDTSNPEASGNAVRRRLETIDDRLHDALSKLGN